MNFMFEWQEQYLTSERSEDLRPPSEDFRRFFKLSEDQTNVPEHFPRISEDCRALSRKTRRCFDDTPTNLSTI